MVGMKQATKSFKRHKALMEARSGIHCSHVSTWPENRVRTEVLLHQFQEIFRPNVAKKQNKKKISEISDVTLTSMCRNFVQKFRNEVVTAIFSSINKVVTVKLTTLGFQNNLSL